MMRFITLLPVFILTASGVQADPARFECVNQSTCIASTCSNDTTTFNFALSDDWADAILSYQEIEVAVAVRDRYHGQRDGMSIISHTYEGDLDGTLMRVTLDVRADGFTNSGVYWVTSDPTRAAFGTCSTVLADPA